MRTAMHIIVLLVLVLHVQQTVSQTVQCYSTFDPTEGTCGNMLGNVQLDDCCMNSAYGYKQDNRGCQSCRLASWTTWSEWSSCSVTCMPGVRQRRRACYGFGRCPDPHVLKNIQTEPCEDISCCPENGAWSEWGSWQPCSVTCEKGQRKRKRTCTNPAPKCGGICIGIGEETEACDTGIVCPTHGGWSAWGSWGFCAGTCHVEGFLPPIQERNRTCTNPPPSVVPRGNNCPGSTTDNQHCTGLPFCAVNGNWGAWSQTSECSVTCGVGQQMQHRKCDSPAAKYGGQDCRGENSKTSLCTVLKHCPADGNWNEWSEWSACESPNERSIACKNRQGRRRRLRECIGREYDGAYCDGDPVDFDRCYDIQECQAGPDKQIPAALWSQWSKWSYCFPNCGENSKQTRKRVCVPDISNYKEPIMEIFSGTPDINCEPLVNTEETRPCLNLPPC